MSGEAPANHRGGPATARSTSGSGPCAFTRPARRQRMPAAPGTSRSTGSEPTGDRGQAWRHGRSPLRRLEHILEVTSLIEKRGGAAVAMASTSTSPPPPPKEAVGPSLERDRGTGRPTKKDRRELDRVRRK